ncbi:DNA topoisomerase I [Sediminicurvatus halobius]|uniref:DNA topoisomerase 1 n=1 Tax=Sediminicurvatus halobius TaxID=2182432 RepID=A0A2U2MZK2_9GAMM|nr:DNA topoisomerase I [Spiribacter halobius]PWG62227.1 DNA topoisomerase I [Spiribacter halobius]UEX78136.1 DNA topoisomerase I [Spiribacter halobius]
MAKNLVIVESPAKARTINKYLGKDFEVMASYGHVRDLVPKEGAVDPEHDFAMQYTLVERNAKHVDAIARAARKADAVYLATDPDREGEAISWHLYELLRERNVLGDKPVHRVVFYEITQSAIQEAIRHPRALSGDLVNAQQARRALDYLVGFNLSPLLWRKITSGLSAGRVQSPALRMIVEREQEIEAFEPQEYWSIEADLRAPEAPEADPQAFAARLSRLDGEKVEQFSITAEGGARAATQRLLEAAGGAAQAVHADARLPEGGVPAGEGAALRVVQVEKKQRRRNPAAPFITSTLQQEASRKLRFSAQQTMRVAQQLYEGVDVGSGTVGLVTYMRTDSVNLSREAIDGLRAEIERRFGPEKLPAKPHQYRTRAKNAQEAHEGIRPTDPARHPEAIRRYLSDDQYRLYDLIWKRSVACQMIHATIDTVAVDLAAGDVGVFRATGSTVRDPGFMAVYQEGQDDASGDSSDRFLPPLEEGQAVPLRAIRPEQHFTEPPPRYSEASLVRALEERGIGRPSTYAAIISTLQQRKYVILDNRRFKPTDTGRVVAKFLTDHFDRYVDYDFTARLEDRLDAISRGERDWVPVLREFWEPFHERVEEKRQVSRSEVMKARELGTDPKSGRPVTARLGRYGPFVQIGTRDDEEKPRFASLRPGQSIETIGLDEALALFTLPRDLGETPDGEPLSVNIGRFGPYVRFGNQFASLKKDDDPYTIDRDRALELVEEKKVNEAKRTLLTFEDGAIRVLRGRFGHYVTDGKKRASVPKDRDAASLTLEDCRELLEAASDTGRGNGRKGAAKGSGKTTKTAKASTAGGKAKTSKPAKGAGNGKSRAGAGTGGTGSKSVSPGKGGAGRATAARRAAKRDA